jgi:outer membrane protein assembly factor BamD
MTALFLLGATTSNAQILPKKKKVDKSTSADNDAQPDKLLYDRAMDDIKHGRHEVGRLSMQTLINTYPDSEYLAKAKLAIADSYFKEGGTANMALAISGYNDFVVFFPFLPEATYAQMQVAMAHYKQLDKPDRDRTQALDAEEAFQTFLQKYPNDPLAPQAQQHLREVQEILAEGEYRIGYYYYVKGDKKAAVVRLLSIANRYPLYSKSDRVLWMVGDIFERSEHKDIAGGYYARIVRNYPLSSLMPQAKDKLKAFGQPIPQADPNAVAWMTAEQNAPRVHDRLVKKPLLLFKSGPDAEMRAAATTGAPNMNPESDMSFGDLLKPTASGSKGAALVSVVPAGGSSANAETVGAGGTSDAGGSSTSTDSGAATAPANNDAPKDAQPTTTEGTATPGASAAVADPGASAAAATNAAAKGAVVPAAESTTGTAAAPAKEEAATTGDAKSDAAPAAQGASADAAKTGDAAASGDSKDGDKKESSSKKKKGLRKLVPW